MAQMQILDKQKSILITGTNGKSTVAYFLKKIFDQAGFIVVTNLQRLDKKEIRADSFLEKMNLAKKSKKDTILILEIDEADFQYFAKRIQPDFIIVTNFSRNQMEKYGELYTLRKNIDRGLELSPKSKLILCADDPLVAALAQDRKEDCYYYGMDNFPAKDSSPEIFRSTPKKSHLPRHDMDDYTYGLFYREAPHCSFCGAELEYQGLAYANYGSYYCPNCQFRRPKLNLGVTALERDMYGVDYVFQNWMGNRKSRIEDENSIKFTFQVPGLFNGYNAGAASLCALLFGLDLKQILQTLETIQPAYGRFESLPKQAEDRYEICLVTASNPEAVNCVLHEIMFFEDFAGLMISNDNLDSSQTDVSWLWDIFFEQMPYAGRVGIGGDFATDLALRLYYAGVEKDRMLIVKDHRDLATTMNREINRKGRLYWLANKPARNAIREIFLSQKDVQRLKFPKSRLEHQGQEVD